MEQQGDVSKAIRRRMDPEISAVDEAHPDLPATPRPLPAELPEPRLTENAIKVLRNRYLKKDKVSGVVVEEPRELFWRVASSVAAPEYAISPAQGERWARRFYDLMARNEFVPNSPTLMNAGREMGML